MGIGLVVCQCGGPLALISSVQQFSLYIHDALKQERTSHKPTFRTYVMLLGKYSGHLAFATDLPFCLAYPGEYLEKKDSGTMMIQNPDNLPVAFMADDMVVCQLLMLDCLEHEYAWMSPGRHLIIPRGVQFGTKLFPEIVILRNHVTPYPDPTTGQEAPFMTVGALQWHGPTVPRYCQRLATAYHSGGDVSQEHGCFTSSHNTRLFHLHIVNISTSGSNIVCPRYFRGVKDGSW